MAVSVPLLGFTDVTEYYSNGTNAGRIHKIATPLLSVTASNDPFVPEKCIIIINFLVVPLFCSLQLYQLMSLELILTHC